MAHARNALPAECCGLLLGREPAIVEAVRARNLAHDPNRFLLDPADHIRARRDARLRGLEVVGFYHSHPHSDPAPSATDLAEAAYPGSLYLIVSPPESGGQSGAWVDRGRARSRPGDAGAARRTAPRMRLYRLDDAGFVALEWTVDSL